jgi:TPR repeat protein
LFREAAAQGYAEAQLGIGYLYENGRGVAMDLVEAFLWYDRAAEDLAAETLSREEREAVFGARDRVFTAMTGAERDTAVARRTAELLSLANQGNAEAQFNLGQLYEPGDRAQAVAWYRKAADQGHAGAQHSLGVLYALGEGVPQDDAEAATLYRKAADQGHTDAQVSLALLYERGDGVPQDYAEAAAWYRKAADQGDSDAQERLDSLYARGLVAK